METIQASFDHLLWVNPAGKARKGALRVDFDRRLKLEIHGTKVTSDAELAKVGLHAGELFPRVGFTVTSLQWKSSNVVRFYDKRGTVEQWTKEGKHGVLPKN